MIVMQKKPAAKKNKRGLGILEKSIVGFFLLVLLLVGFSSGFIMQISNQMPDVASIGSSATIESTIIYASDNSVLGTIHGEQNRVTVSLDKISPFLIKAVIASEDNDFYNHRGISIKGIARASVTNLLHGRVMQGGSTITQQLARTLFLTTRKTMGRKFSEMFYAIELERNFTKTEILEMYLNQVYWGHNSFGADAAAQLYFGKHADSLTLAEAALMAGILGAPEYYSPYKNFDDALRKRSVVLDKMAKLKMITPSQAEKAKNEKVSLSMIRVNKYKFNAPYFTTFVINQLVEKYGRDVVYKGGLRVYTSLHMPFQTAAEDAMNKFITEEGPKYRFSQGALLSIDPRNGNVLAMIGGADIDKSEYNRATQAKRSPGSSFKPFIYASAIEKGFSPNSLVNDCYTEFDVFADAQHPDGKWRPNNFDRKFHGMVTIRTALERSLNIPAIKAIREVGISSAIDMAHRLGIKSDLAENLSLSLGTTDVSLFEMVSAYCSFATIGLKSEPIYILKVTDINGKVIEENAPRSMRVLDENVAYTMVDMMKGVLTKGTGFKARINRPAAAKTGTSNDFKDAWFIGFIPQIVTGVWVGNDNNQKMKGVAEVAVCPRIWKTYMTSIGKDVPVEDFAQPANWKEYINSIRGKNIDNPVIKKQKQEDDYDIEVKEILEPVEEQQKAEDLYSSGEVQ